MREDNRRFNLILEILLFDRGIHYPQPSRDERFNLILEILLFDRSAREIAHQ